jgi:hypothetical protein
MRLHYNMMIYHILGNKASSTRACLNERRFVGPSVSLTLVDLTATLERIKLAWQDLK